MASYRTTDLDWPELVVFMLRLEPLLKSLLGDVILAGKGGQRCRGGTHEIIV